MAIDPASTVRFGPWQLRNRLAMAPMVTLFPEVADQPTPHHIEFYARRARGGIGLVLVGATYVSREGKGFPNQMGIDADDKVTAFRQLAGDVQAHAPAILQLFHAGAKTMRSVSGGDLVAPSASTGAGTRYDPARAMTTREVEAALSAFEAAAQRAREAGFSGVELHGANGYLLHAFTEPRANRRMDRWGAPNAFVVELLSRLRRRLPAEFLVGYTLGPFRIGDSGEVDAGSRQRFVEFAHTLADTGADYLHVYRGKAETRVGSPPRVFAAALRHSGLTLPIIEGTGIRCLADAEIFLREGATLAAVGRALLDQPNLVGDPRHECAESVLATLSESGGIQRAFEAEYARHAERGDG